MFDFDYETISNTYDDIKKKKEERFNLTIELLDKEITRNVNSKIESDDFSKEQDDADDNPYYMFTFSVDSVIPLSHIKVSTQVKTPFATENCPVPINLAINKEHMEYYKKNVCSAKNCFMTYFLSSSSGKYEVNLYFFATKEEYEKNSGLHLYD